MPAALVSYGSSSSETEEDKPPAPASRHKRSAPSAQIAPATTTSNPPPAKKKRGLPKLPTSFDTASTPPLDTHTPSPICAKADIVKDPKDDPAQHQGRKRSRPFVQGDYNAHIYISLPIPTTLRRTIEELITLAGGLCPGQIIQSLVSTPSHPVSGATQSDLNGGKARKSSTDLPLHISLTHPLPLRQSQLVAFRDDLRAALRQTEISTGTRPIRLSLAGDVVGFVNGRRYGGEGAGGRAFLALRVSAGSKEIERLVTDIIHPILAKLHLPLYHSNPQFHTSFAWTLTDPSTLSAGESGEDGDDLADQVPATSQSTTGDHGHTPFTPEVLAVMSKRFGKALIDAQPRGGWEIGALELKIGKEIHKLPL